MSYKVDTAFGLRGTQCIDHSDKVYLHITQKYEKLCHHFALVLENPLLFFSSTFANPIGLAVCTRVNQCLEVDLET